MNHPKTLLAIFAISLLTVSVVKASSQTKASALEARLRKAEAVNVKNTREIAILRDDLKTAREKIESLSSQVISMEGAVAESAAVTSSRIEDVQRHSQERLQSIDDSVYRTALYLGLGLFGIGGLIGLVYTVQRRRLRSDRTDMEEQIRKTHSSLEEATVKLDAKLVGVLEQRMNGGQQATPVPVATRSEKDHSLALRVADEIVRMQKNLAAIDPATKGHKQLVASTKRIQDTFAANGYEIVDMLNRPYNDGMKVIANFRPDENLKPDEQIITRIIKPQVNYGGVMIQAAQIEVSQG